MTAADSRPTRRSGQVIGMLAMMLPGALAAQQSSHAAETPRARYTVETNEDLQPTVLPPMPVGMTVDMLVEGDRLFHGRGGCFACHGAEAQGLPAAGDGITSALSYARHEWRSIDSLITAGMPDAISRSPIAMPARGARGDLTAAEIQRLAAYVWAISAVRGEPWPGGHTSHAGLVPPGSTKGTAPDKPVRVRHMVPTPSRGQVTGTARSTNHDSQARP
jgi:mono/diheme cytochrome c family protein